MKSLHAKVYNIEIDDYDEAFKKLRQFENSMQDLVRQAPEYDYDYETYLCEGGVVHIRVYIWTVKDEDKGQDY